MAYIGKEPIVGNFQKCDAISVVNGQAAYTLQVSSTNVVPESANHMLVSLNGILQAPVTSFTVSGSTLTFASNLATGDVIDFVILLGNVLDLGTPSDGTVTNAKLAQDIISGETALTAIPDKADELLISDGGTLKRIDAQFFQNTPSFLATKNDAQSISHDTWTKLQVDDEVWDSDSTYDASSNHRFTPAIAGKYLLVGGFQVTLANANNLSITFYKNGSALNLQARYRTYSGSDAATTAATISTIVDSDDDDYFELYVHHQTGGSANSHTEGCFFGGHKLIGI